MASAADRVKSPARTSVWLDQRPPSRTRRADQPAGLDREKITAATVRLLDAEGLAKFSMRRLAAELDVTAMSLYWYVDTKDDLLELALDSVYREITPLREEDAHWHDRLRELATTYRELLVRHVWVSPLAGHFLNIGPHSMLFSYAVQDVIRATGLPLRRQTEHSPRSSSSCTDSAPSRAISYSVPRRRDSARTSSSSRPWARSGPSRTSAGCRVVAGPDGRPWRRHGRGDARAGLRLRLGPADRGHRGDAGPLRPPADPWSVPVPLSVPAPHVHGRARHPALRHRLPARREVDDDVLVRRDARGVRGDHSAGQLPVAVAGSRRVPRAARPAPRRPPHRCAARPPALACPLSRPCRR